MSDVKWIKISTGIFDDEKIRYIEQLPECDSILTIWVKLLVLAGMKNSGGEIYFNDEMPYTEEMLAAIFHRKVNTVRLALETFSKLRMIELSADRTIVICNWGKHQNLDGLDRIRELAKERQRARRNRQALTRHATRHVTKRDASREVPVTVPLQIENKRIEEPPTVPPGGTGADALDVKQALNDLFGRRRDWSEEEDTLLAKILPVTREDLELLRWGYALDRDSDGWTVCQGKRLTKPKQSVITLLRDFPAELDKWTSAKTQIEPDTAHSRADDWPSGAKKIAAALYPDASLPEQFRQLPRDVQDEILSALSDSKTGKAA